MAGGEVKKLLDWLAEVDGDRDVLHEFFRQGGGLEAAVNKAIDKGHELPNAHKDFLIRNRHDPEQIGRKLKEESFELESDSSVHQFWVLVRI